MKAIERIFWIDDQPQSVAALSQALGFNFIPPRIVAFFPQELEDRLLEKELSYRGCPEDQIQETVFRVDRRGQRYEPVVVDQKTK